VVKRALCIGINDYPGTGNDLGGCVNDANDWAGLLSDQFGFGGNITMLLDADATRANIVSALGDLVTSAKGGDIVVCTYSGHGTWEYDRGELDEPDNRDEAICGHDDIILDDELRVIIRQIDPAAHLTVISDSCHSGTVTRAMLKRTRDADRKSAEFAPRRRYMPPKDEKAAMRTPLVPVRKRFLYPDWGMPEVLLTGCNSTEYSYDAFIDGRYNGAMTATAIRLIRENPNQTYMEFWLKLRMQLPSQSFPQSPQLEGAPGNLVRPLFG
jgi:hypothetical protein